MSGCQHKQTSTMMRFISPNGSSKTLVLAIWRCCWKSKGSTPSDERNNCLQLPSFWNSECS